MVYQHITVDLSKYNFLKTEDDKNTFGREVKVGSYVGNDSDGSMMSVFVQMHHRVSRPSTFLLIINRKGEIEEYSSTIEPPPKKKILKRYISLELSRFNYLQTEEDKIKIGNSLDTGMYTAKDKDGKIVHVSIERLNTTILGERFLLQTSTEGVVDSYLGKLN